MGKNQVFYLPYFGAYRFVRIATDFLEPPREMREHFELSEAIRRYQDDATGLWYQVIDKGERPDNWLENSCTSLYVHAIAKAMRFGYLEEKYLSYAWKGYQGVIDTLGFDENGRAVIGNICIGTGIGDYAHYIARPTSENDLHGAGAFILMCVEMHHAAQQR
jgi:unsaturated rhamnogalacturonyl hydrolase